MAVVDDVNYCKFMNKLYQNLAQTFSPFGFNFFNTKKVCEAGQRLKEIDLKKSSF